VIALILIAIGYSLKKGLFQTTRLIICIACVIPAIYIVYCHKKNALSHKFCIYNIELAINGKTFTSSAYMDTGNSLMDLSGRNVIITDCFYAGELLGNAYIDLLEAYHNQKNFDYIKANSISDIFFCPVPCRTVSSDFFIMPGFVANSIMYRETGRAYHNITIAISPNRLSFLKDAKLLSNQNLKP
jgi:hypothetical protein